MTSVLSSDQLSAIHQLLDRIAERPRSDFGHIVSDVKPDGTLITACDRWSDAELIKGLASIAPGEGVLSEEGSQLVPQTRAYWVVDPLDGTTNFATGIPVWAISVARFVDGRPSEVFLDVPALGQRFVALRGRGVSRNDQSLTASTRQNANSACVSLCSRSIVCCTETESALSRQDPFVRGGQSQSGSVAMGQTVAALEATPKIWDLAAAWLVLDELGCPIRWLKADPAELSPGQDLSQTSFPMLAAGSWSALARFLPWGEALVRP